ncbi:MAG: type IV toxin-antitoxin system AbiEi family antitoxin domain-containing protein [Deltaproteobacteria bacterium]|nr:type IV toxin-antitoxin system AbiEi family antitoxin domain-containing protein [Deltaproteobacteria bacterium]
MNASDALARLSSLGVPSLRTADAAAALGLSPSAASVALARLARAGLIKRVRSGTWWLGDGPDPLRLPEFLTAPLPSYVSLLSALSIHGMIEQLPQVTYAVSLARTQVIKTSVGVVSVHHIDAELFGGFVTLPSMVKVATPEKALFDLAYLSGGRSRRFAALPELELPRRFKQRELSRWLARVPSPRARTLTSRRLEQWLS